MSPNNGILLNVFLRSKRLNNLFASCSFINIDFFLLRHIENFDDNIVLLIVLVLLIYNDYYIKTLRLRLLQLLSLLLFCFKNLDLPAIQLVNLDLSLITLFFIITFFETILFASFKASTVSLHVLYIDGNIFLTATLDLQILLNDFLQVKF